MAVLVSAMEMVGALLVFGFFALLVDPGSTDRIPLISSYFPSGGTGSRSVLFVMAAVVTSFFVVRGALYLFQVYAQNRVAHNAGVRLAARLLDGYLRMPYEFHLRRNSSELIRNSQNTTLDIVLSFFLPTLNITSQVFVVGGVFAALLLASPVATGLLGVIMVPTMFLPLRVISPRTRRLGATRHAMSKAALQSLQEGLHGVREVKLGGQESFIVRRFNQAKAAQAKSMYLRATLGETPRVLMEVFLVLFVVLFLFVASDAGSNARESVPVLGLIGYAGLRLLPSLSRIASNLNQLHFNNPALDDIVGELQLLEAAPIQQSHGIVVLQKEIEVRGLGFKYEGSKERVLESIDLSIPKGSFVGIVGGTGSGKSTLLDLLVGLLQPTEGAIFVDGVPIAPDVRGWQAIIGVVSQTPFLLDTSIRNNIALGIDPADIDDVKLTRAVHVAQLETFVASLPDGLHSVIGERGTRLSGGQRQRVAIARALYRSPSVLFFDEATSALDRVTEARLFGALHEAFGGSVTQVVVAHRLASLETCDTIFVMEHGRIKDRGKYAALRARNDLFQSSAPGSDPVQP